MRLSLVVAALAVSGIVDRFEGAWAFVETPRGVLRVLRSRLPRGVREGDVLAAGRVDRRATRRARARAAALQRALRSRSGAGRVAPARPRAGSGPHRARAPPRPWRAGPKTWASVTSRGNFRHEHARAGA